MSVSERLQTQKFHFETVTSQGTYSYTIKVDNLYLTNDLYVMSIETPQGAFLEDIPLPEEVVRDIVSSMDSILGENVPTISLDNTTFNFEATETGDNPDAQDVVISNIGSFGSLLSVGLTPDETWISSTPDSVGNIAKDEEETVSISVDVEGLSAGSYVGTIEVADDRASNTPQTIDINFTVLPRPEIEILPATDLNFAGIVNGANPPVQILSVSNSGPATSILNWTAQVVTGSSWLSVNPTSGGPMSDTDPAIAMSVIVDISGMAVGSYVGLIRISDPVASNSPIDINVNLTISL